MTALAETDQAQLQPVQSSRGSRRALLTGALGGLGAFAAAALGRRDPTRASDPNDVVLGGANAAAALTSITNSSNGTAVFRATSNSSGIAVEGTSNSNVGVNGASNSSPGVHGTSFSSIGVFGLSTQRYGVQGNSFSSAQPANVGWSGGNNTGVMGYSNNNSGLLPASKPKTGMYGYANQDSQARGVWGHSPAGIGVYGQTSTGYAGYFFGKVFSTQFYELAEIATPGAPGANKARLFIRDNGAGKSQLCVRFATGSVKLLAMES